MNFLVDKFKKYRPKPTYPSYPCYHTGLYLEDYFYNYYYNNNIETRRTFIPVSWTTLYIENKTSGLQQLLDSLDPNDSYFIISQHDDAVKEKLPKNTIRFCAGGNSGGIPIPLVCSPIPKKDIPKNDKDLLCSFNGSITHHIRQKLVYTLKNKNHSIIEAGIWSISVGVEKYKRYLDVATRSRFLLCPRGYGPHSFRQYEAFQLGCVPVIITDIRFLPWEDTLNWDDFAIITNDIDNLYETLEKVSDERYNSMLATGQQIYNDYFTLEGTCKQIIKKLNMEIDL